MKKLIATLFLSGEKAVKSIGNREVISDDPVRYALRLIDYNIDALYVLEMSRSDIEHEIALSVIHQIVSVSDVPVYVAGNIKTKFDVENLLEMGCRRVFLNLSKESNIAILKRFASIGFKDNLGGAVTETNQIPMYQELFDDGGTELIVMRESIISDVIKSGFPKLIIPVSDIPLDRAMDILERKDVTGIFGSFINYNLSNVNSVKQLCRERGIDVNAFVPQFKWRDLKKDSNGLVPVVVQDYTNNEVLMVAYMDENAYNKTINTGIMTYYSRSRQSEWIKGETSGHYQFVKQLFTDCDLDTILAKVSQVGAACHTGKRSCFFNEIISRKAAN